MRAVIKQPEFVIDIVEIAVYLSEQSGELISQCFLDSVEATIADIVEMPEVGRVRDFNASKLSGLRSLQVKNYRNHLIFYLCSEAKIEFGSCMAPATWKLYSTRNKPVPH